MQHPRPPIRRASSLSVCAVFALTGCATYQPAPLEPVDLLQQLEALRWEDPGDPSSENSQDPQSAAATSPLLGPLELAAFAVRTNPRLRAVRAKLGLQRALLVEAGLLQDPELSWDAMDVLASQIVDGSSSRIDALSGLGLMFPLFRPGERGARIGAAEWSVEEARRLVETAEWNLTRDIHLAWEEVRAAELLQEQSRVVTELAESTYDYFKRAKEAGAATAIQANLALGELQAIQLDALRATSRAQAARQSLNALLGLPPSTELVLGAEEFVPDTEALGLGPEALALHAAESRPDLAALLAAYQAAEQGVRLAVSMQYPRISLGTGIGLSLPIFSRFGRPAIRSAIARRSLVEQELTAALHSARQEIADLYRAWRFAEREYDLVANALLPNAEENLELSREAFREGEVTLLETLALQRALVDARTRYTESKSEQAKRAWALLAASGWLLSPDPSNTTNRQNDQEADQ